MEIFDLTLSPPVLRQLQCNTPISITPISDLGTSRIHSCNQFSKPMQSSECDHSDLSFPFNFNMHSAKHGSKAGLYPVHPRKLRQVKMTDYITSQKVLTIGKENPISPHIDLSDSLLMNDQLLEGHQSIGSLLSSIVNADFGKLKMSDFVSDPVLGLEGPMQSNEPIFGPREVNCTNVKKPEITDTIFITGNHDSFHSCTLVSLASAKLITPKVSDSCRIQCFLTEIRDILKEVKQSVSTIEGYLKENKMCPVGNPEDLLNQRQTVHPHCPSDKMNYYSLSPKTIDKIDKLSLEELLLCVGPQTGAQGNPYVSVPNTVDFFKPPLVTVSPSIKHKPSGKAPSKICEKAPAHPPVEDKLKHVKTKKTKGIRKQTSKKRRSMNFKPLFKLLESSEHTVKGKSSGANVQQADSQIPASSKDNSRTKKARFPMDSGIKQLMDPTISTPIQSSSTQGSQPSDWGSLQPQSTRKLSTIQSSSISNSTVGNPIPVIIRKRSTNVRFNKRRSRWNNEFPGRVNSCGRQTHIPGMGYDYSSV